MVSGLDLLLSSFPMSFVLRSLSISFLPSLSSPFSSLFFLIHLCLPKTQTFSLISGFQILFFLVSISARSTKPDKAGSTDAMSTQFPRGTEEWRSLLGLHHLRVLGRGLESAIGNVFEDVWRRIHHHDSCRQRDRLDLWISRRRWNVRTRCFVVLFVFVTLYGFVCTCYADWGWPIIRPCNAGFGALH